MALKELGAVLWITRGYGCAGCEELFDDAYEASSIRTAGHWQKGAVKDG